MDFDLLLLKLAYASKSPGTMLDRRAAAPRLD